MRQLAQQCLAELRNHLVAGGIGLTVGFGLGLLAPSLGLFISLGPLLMIALCLLPCLAPLILLRRLNGGQRTPLPETPTSSNQEAPGPPVVPGLEEGRS